MSDVDDPRKLSRVMKNALQLGERTIGAVNARIKSYTFELSNLGFDIVRKYPYFLIEHI